MCADPRSSTPPLSPPPPSENFRELPIREKITAQIPHLLTTRHTTPLSPRQLTAARLLLAGHTQQAIAEAMRLHRHTLTRWKKDPRFQAELRRQLDHTAAKRHIAPQKGTSPAPGPNEPKPATQRTPNSQ